MNEKLTGLIKELRHGAKVSPGGTLEMKNDVMRRVAAELENLNVERFGQPACPTCQTLLVCPNCDVDDHFTGYEP